MNQQAERRVGTVIGAKWRVDALLGSGSMAAVYAVTHRNGARAALKILHPTLCTDPAVCERFLGEGYLTNSVKHPGIVRVLDDGATDDGCVFLVMDLLEGETLEAYRQRCGGRIPLIETLDIAEKLMDVLSAVHHAGIIHRDLKPQNVFLCNDGALKLLDFGVARVLDRTSQSKLSMFGLVLGTPSFMSPEQALGSRDKVDHRSDIWSLGATMFTSLTGETVHLGANVQARLLAAATVKARSIQMVMPDLPLPIAAAIDMALRFKKEDRWQSVDAFRRAVRDARQELGLGRLPTPVDPFEIRGGSVRPPPAAEDAPAAEGPSTKSSQGPDGTFIGVGSGQGDQLKSLVGNDGSVPPADLGAPVLPPPAHVPNIATPVGARSSRPDGHESSIPATFHGSSDDSIGTPVDEAVYGRRKKRSGVWVSAVLFACVAIGGIAFVAVKDQQRSSAVNGNDVPPGEVPSAIVIPSAVPDFGTPQTIVIGDEPVGDAGATETPPSSASATTTARPTTFRPTTASRPNNPATPVAARPSEEPTPPATATATAPTTTTTAEPPRPPPNLAPDPFGTPE